MTIDSVREFVAQLEREDELVRITTPVKARLELCEIADRVMKQPGGGKALLFENVTLDDGRRSQFPVAINLFGSMRRMAMSLGVERLDDIGARITELLDLKVPEGLLGKLSLLPRLMEVAKFPPRVSSGARAVPGDRAGATTKIDLRELPIITCWPEDGGPYITLPHGSIARIRCAESATSACIACSTTRRTRSTMHWQRHKVGAAHWREMAERGETHAGVHRDRRRSAVDLFGLGAAAADDRRVHLRRISARARTCR